MEHLNDSDPSDQLRDPLELMRPAEVQRLLAVSRAWLYRAAKEGLLPSLRLGPNGPVRFIRADVEEFIEAARATWRISDAPADALRRARDNARGKDGADWAGHGPD